MALTPSDTKKLSRSDSAPNFSLPGADGKTYTLSDFSQYEGLLVIFMCNHCPYVKTKMDDLVKLNAEFGEKIAMVGINSNDPDFPGEGMENMKSFIQEWNMSFPYLLDASQKIAKLYGATCTPDPFLFDSNHTLVFHGKVTNAMSPNDTATEYTMRDNITTLLRGETIEKWFDPSLGCSIKWIG